MGFVKKAVFGMAFTFLIFIAINIADAAGFSLFKPEFLGFAGLVILLGMGAIETNFVLYE